MIWYLLVINFITFILYYIDKKRSIQKRARIREYTLFVFGFFGGSIGALLGMNIFHHKTKKFQFWFFNILFLILWTISLM